MSYEELPELLTVAKFSAITGISTQHIRRMCADKTIPCCKIGRTWFINKRLLESAFS